MNNYSNKQFVQAGDSYTILDIKQEGPRFDALLLRDDGVAVIGHGFDADSKLETVRWSQGSYFMNGLKDAAKKFYKLIEDQEEEND
jgi:uncharacterized protein (DUF2164 family)